MRSLRMLAVVEFTITTILLFFSTAPLASAQNSPLDGTREFEVMPKHLTEHGLHLPSYMSIEDLLKLQTQLPTHQSLNVQWESHPGQEGIMRREDAEETQPAPNFTILERKRHQPGAPGKGDLRLGEDQMVIVAATDSGEIRCLMVGPDPRMSHAEWFDGQNHGHHQDFVTPKGTFYNIFLPDDPQITRLVFLKPKPQYGKWRLEEMGVVNLQTGGQSQ